MTPADTLRSAARLMRGRAHAAEGPPWVIHPAEHRPHGYDVVADRLVVAEVPCPACVQHVASWHPGVALAVADWLDEEADDAATTHQSIDLEHVYRSALAVARGYLGEVMS